MDDLKLSLDDLMTGVFSANIKIFSSDIGMQFGISKCAMLEMQKSNMQIEGIAWLNGDTIKSLEKQV